MTDLALFCVMCAGALVAALSALALYAMWIMRHIEYADEQARRDGD